MKLDDKKLLVTGGAGFIGSHIIDLLTKTNASEIIVYDNFQRGTRDNLEEALKDDRVSIYPHGGDITQEDLLNDAMQGSPGCSLAAAVL